MSSFTIEVQDAPVKAALKAVAERFNNMPEVLDNLGTKIIERTQRRFETSTGPDGVKWKVNSEATLSMLSNYISGYKSYRKKDGSLNAAGLRKYANKKPLIGISHRLSTEFHSEVVGNTLSVSSSLAYAAMQQFGGVTSAKSWIPGKTIPARPFLPIHQDGTLYPDEQAEILEELNAYLMDGL